MAYSIDLDAPPGAVRPDALLEGVLRDTGLTPEDFKNTSRFFGNWEFVLLPGKEELYEKVRADIKEKVCALYNSGAIRYGSW